MQKKFCLLVSLVFIAVLILPRASQGTLLTNGDFETGDGTGWDNWGFNFAVVSDPVYSQDVYSATLWWSDAGWVQLVSATEGETYTLSGDMIHNPELNKRVAILKLEFWDAGDTTQIAAYEIGRLGTQDDADTWFSYSDSFVAPTGTGLVKVVLLYEDLTSGGPGDPAGLAYWDNIVLTPEPATVALLGLGGLLILRRRRYSS